MARQALYRKYRPRTFADIVGQEHITQTLENAITSGKLSHAYLFTGPHGVGKTSTARILAHQVNDFEYDEETTHLDIIEIDAASNRRIDEIRDLRDKIHIAPNSGKFKIYIIDEVHMLTREAFNALLKTLEEPPLHAIFILATTEAHKLPATIVSRTQRYGFRPVKPTTVADYLEKITKEEKIQIDRQALELLAEHGGGSLRDATSLLDQMANHDKHITAEYVQDRLGLLDTDRVGLLDAAIDSGSVADVFNLLESMYEAGVSASQIADSLARHWRKSIVETNSHHKLIGLDKMLNVISSRVPHRTLEAALAMLTLEHAPKVDVVAAPQPPKTAPKPVKKELKPTKRDEKQQPKEAEKPAPKPASTDGSPAAAAENWAEIVKDVKNVKPGLAAVLRQATAKEENGALVLQFKYPLHLRKAKQGENLTLLNKSIESVTGAGVQIEVVKAETQQAKQEAPTKAPTNGLDKITSMLGGDIIDIGNK